MDSTARKTKKVSCLNILIGALLGVCILITVYITTGSIGIEIIFDKIWTFFGFKAGGQVTSRTSETKYYKNGSYTGQFLNGK
jgi:hypothetical protein